MPRSSYSSSPGRSHTVYVVAGLAAAASISLLWYIYQLEKEQRQLSSADGKGKDSTKSLPSTPANKTKSRQVTPPPQQPQKPGTPASADTTTAGDRTPTTSNTARAAFAGALGETHLPNDNDDETEGTEARTPLVRNDKHHLQEAKERERQLHTRIEELDKKGKALFKNKQFMEAAQTFTEALELIGEYDTTSATGVVATNSLSRQLITLMNNRSAMYEKASMPELALDDCSSILELEANHAKARTRKLRILEALHRWYDCLVEICAMQLLFMQANRTNLRMGLPTPPPPVPQSKMEQVLGHVVPEQVEKYSVLIDASKSDDESATERPPPSSYTILQLLKSYTGYNKWMAQAAKDGAVTNMDPLPVAADLVSAADRASGLLKRGRRHVYDGGYASAMKDFEEGYQLLLKYEGAGELMEDDCHARLLEWAGMARHWRYRLDPATECYEKCATLEPDNPLILVKQAGVCMDGSLQAEAMEFFRKALQMEPNCADALLHRSNLYMIQAKPEDAKRDLERCVKANPNHVMARLRLASILAATQDPDGANRQLDAAERVEPNSSEVQSYRGELHFTQNQMEDARVQFEKAMKLEPNNPTPYVNAAMAILNTPPTAPGQVIDAPAAIELLEKALSVDPQFMAAYVQLGQLKLGTATELTAARQVIELYDTALTHCRTKDDLKELCSMRILAVAQVEAASMLKMETFNLQ